MNKIKILSDQEARKVAAGEVVERPANIVKELMENALDAGATAISVYIEEAGKQLIRVVDNGCGMSSKDVEMSIQAHATSKITQVEDLSSIGTFGFRGEALASISSVSDFCIISKEADKGEDTALGTKLTVSYGGKPALDQVACSVGTDISVVGLFENIPVRKKFLKQNETEWNQIVALVQAFALSNIAISIKLFSNNKMMLNLPSADDVKKRVLQIWGYNFSENIIPLIQDDKKQKKHNWFSAHGLISNHHFWRYNRSTMFFFVNNRWVKQQDLGKAVIKGFSNVLPPKRFPVAFIFITADAEHVDVNVHPKKEEVRFSHPVVVQRSLQESVTKSLEAFLSQQVAVKPETQSHYQPTSSELINRSPQKVSETTSPLNIPNNFMAKDSENFSAPLPMPIMATSPQKDNEHKIEQLPVQEFSADSKKKEEVVQQALTPEPSVQGTIVGQLFNTYIILEQKESMVIIDQHAAHERIMYEKFSSYFGEHEGTRLMFPTVIKLEEEQLNLLLRYKDFFIPYGLEIDQMGKQELAVTSSPSGLQRGYALKELVLETAGFLQEHGYLDEKDLLKQLSEHMHSQMACKAAIRAGDKLTLEQMHKLVQDLFSTKNRFICAHGRPTTWTLEKREFEKKFRRC